MDIISEVNRAVGYSKNKEYKKAEKIYLEILKHDEKNSVVLSLLGLLYMNICQFKKAEKYLEEALTIKSSKATLEGLGIVKSYLGKDSEAVKYFEKIISDTKSFEAYDRYIKTLVNLKENSKAYELSEKCYNLYPMKPESLNNLAFVGIHAGRLKEAFNYGNQLIKQYPKYPDGWLTFGMILEILYHDDIHAGECFKMAYNLGAKEAGTYNLAVNASKRNLYDKALYYAKKLKKYNPTDSSIDFLLANIYLKTRRFKQGMKHYVSYVYRHPQNDKKNPATKLKRLWDGGRYKDETIFVFCDQGIGDGLMFIRYIPFLEKYFKKIKIMASDKMIDLLKRSFKSHKRITFYPVSRTFPRYDKSVILSTLPYKLKMYYDNIPSADKYIIADEGLVKKYSDKINSDKLKVGICWEAGGTGWRELLNRTLNISLYEPFLKIKNVQFYSLQVNPTMNNYKNYDLITLGEGFKNFDDTAGAVSNLDLVITVDTSVAHLAGGLGIKTFMLLPYCPDWRWFDNDKKSEWYNSLTIFKQTNPQSWDEPVNDIATELAKMIKEK